ncbi:MAG: hypothetical protein WD401_06830, partial [Thermomicrobiaceae bacterium]
LPSRNKAHLRFKVAVPDSAPLSAISFGAGERFVELHGMSRADLALSLRPNTWQGKTSVSLEVVDFRRPQ